jgi:FkbM family methyltransferase
MQSIYNNDDASASISSSKMMLIQDDRRTYLPTNTVFIMNQPNPTAEWMVREGIPERLLIEFCTRFCDRRKVFLDIGAHMGTYSLLLASKCKEVHSFEAQRMTYYQLCGGIALNKAYNVTAHHCAISNTEEAKQGQLTLNIISEDGGGSTLNRDFADLQGAALLGTEQVPVKTIDQFEFKEVGFIKIDVEGHELQVLEGARHTILTNNYPPILLEAWNDEWYMARKLAVLTHLAALGYNRIQPFPRFPNMLCALRDQTDTTDHSQTG